MDQQVKYEVVVPLLGMRDAALLAISTILDPSNFYTKLVCCQCPPSLNASP